MSCIICGRDSEEHHLMTQKAHPELVDEAWNKIKVCRQHHSEFHSKGTNHMQEKYYRVKHWLHNNGWVYDAILLKWRYSV
jgi:hypothetical protein